MAISTQNGLPASNGAFGARDVEYYFQGGLLEAAPIEVFYQAGAYTHPVGSVKWCQDTPIGTPGHLRPDHLISGSSPIPNWFEYYSQAWSSPEPIAYEPQGFAGQGRSYYMPGEDHVHISDDAHGASIEFEPFYTCYTGRGQ